MYFGLIVPAYGYAYFAPSIIKTYDYGPIETQLHSVPPWAAAFGFSMLMAFLSDFSKMRMPFAIFAICVAITGFGILISVHDNTQLQYAALFLVAMGAYTAMPIIVCWFNMNLGKPDTLEPKPPIVTTGHPTNIPPTGGHHRRAVGSAWQVGFGNIGGIIAVFAFLEKDAPKYIPGYSISISFTILSILACIVYGIGCFMANRRRAKQPVDLGMTETEKTEMGDMNPEYRYLL